MKKLRLRRFKLDVVLKIKSFYALYWVFFLNMNVIQKQGKINQICFKNQCIHLANEVEPRMLAAIPCWIVGSAFWAKENPAPGCF